MRRLVLCGALALAGAAPAALARGDTLPYDHVHLVVPEPAKAAEWYVRYMGGVSAGPPDQVAFGATLFMFRKGDAQPSARTVIDHVGFSFANLEQKMREWQAAGVKVTSPVRTVPGLFPLAFIEDPWGVKIEAVQDPEALGFHHVHLRATDPEAMLAWLAKSFGGERVKMKDRLDAVRYGAVSILVQRSQEPPDPSAGHVLDHLGWRVPDVDRLAAELKEAGTPITIAPRNAGALRIAFVEGPEHLRVELLRRP